jgi:DNA-directed RNA polymerase I subunit RPA1
VEGTNLRSIPYLAEGIVDITRIKTNNIHAMLMTYGVEAARATIIQEIANVFALYSINVNVRHLMLIADYMVSSMELEHDTRV